MRFNEHVDLNQYLEQLPSDPKEFAGWLNASLLDNDAEGFLRGFSSFLPVEATMDKEKSIKLLEELLNSLSQFGLGLSVVTDEKNSDI